MPEDHSSLSDDELVNRLRDNRRGSAVWAAALIELQKRGDRVHNNEHFQAALEAADDGSEVDDPGDR